MFFPGTIILKSEVVLTKVLFAIERRQPSTATALTFVPVVSIKIPFSKLSHFEHSNDVELYNGEQFEELCELHNNCALKENLMTLRDNTNQFCDTPLESADYTYIHRNSKGEADGYVRFTVKRPESVCVKELYCLTPSALNALVGMTIHDLFLLPVVWS